MSKILTSNVIPELKGNTTPTLLYEGSFFSYNTGVEKSITLSDVVSNYSRLEFDCGLVNWGGAGRTMIGGNAKGISWPLAITYFATDGTLLIKGGVLQIHQNNKVYWQPQRSYTKEFYESAMKLITATSADCIVLYRILGYK